MDTFLAIVGLALSVASLVPAFTSKSTKTRIVAVAISVSLVGILGWQYFLVQGERRRIEHAKDDVMRMLAGNRSMSFEQIYAELNYVDYSTAAAAVDELVAQHSIHHRPVEVTSASGAKYVVRVYNSVNFPIP